MAKVIYFLLLKRDCWKKHEAVVFQANVLKSVDGKLLQSGNIYQTAF